MSRDKVSDPEPRLVRTAVGDISLTDEGDGPPILCVHGIPGSHRDFRYLAPHLTDAFRVIRLNMPGFGGSPFVEIDSVAGWARTFEAVADALDLDHVLFVSHSFGGAPVMHAATRWPRRIAGIALLASPGIRRHRGDGEFPRILYRMLAIGAGLPLIRIPIGRLARRIYARLNLRAPEGWRGLHRQIRVGSSVDFGTLGRLAPRISCPTLLAHCADDRLVERSIVEELAATIPNSHTLLFSDGGHHLQKTRAKEIGRAITELFAGACVQPDKAARSSR